MGQNMDTSNKTTLSDLLQSDSGKASALIAAQGTPRIGEHWPHQGGIYAGIIRDGDNQWHLILPTDLAAHGTFAWGAYGTNEPTATSRSNGLANTQALVASEHQHPAAEWAAALTIDGHNDFYLPAQKELNLIFVNLQEFMEGTWHWSSTQYSAHGAWIQDFGDGNQTSYGKDGELAVRAVRRLPI